MEILVHEFLQDAVEKLHNCRASFVEDIVVIEKFGAETVWGGTVSVFALKGHPVAKKCYAWSHETDSGKRKFFAVLHQAPVDSPQAAVRAAIVAEYRQEKEH